MDSWTQKYQKKGLVDTETQVQSKILVSLQFYTDTIPQQCKAADPQIKKCGMAIRIEKSIIK